MLSAPGFLLAGVLATAVPVVIFLLWRHRRRPVRWAAMRFLLEAEQAKRRRRQLERLLLLAIRCLILVLLGAALARPLLEGGGATAGGRRTVVLLIDEAMTAGLRESAGDGTVLTGHVAAARGLIASLSAGDRVGVVRASRSGPDLLPPSADLESVGRWLESLEPAAVRADMPAALRVAGTAAREARDTGSEPSIHVLSEFRAGSLDPEDAPPDLGLTESVGLFARDPAADVRSNTAVVGIDAVRSVIVPGAADGSGQVSVRLRRHGELDAARSTVRVEVPGLRTIEPRTVTWTAGQTEASVDLRLPVEIDGVGGTARPLVVTASIDADELPVDDSRSVVLEATPSLRIALLDRRGFGRDGAIDRIGAGGWLERALNPGEGASMDLVRLEPAALSAADLRGVAAAVVPRPDLLRTEGWRHLANFARRGGLVLLSPPEDAVVHGWLDEFEAAWGADWRIERETEVLSEPVGLAVPRRLSPLLGLL
ncbi:MAG: BatA domain-containing protein, partial [Planctomycetota bacterium]